MADHRFADARTWAELTEAHDRFAEDYNVQAHWAHRERADGRRSPAEVLGFLSGVRHREEELRRAFFSSRFARTLDSLGYARFRHWRLYGEEALAGREAALWLAAESLTLEHAGEPLSRYAVSVEERTGELRSVGRARLFETSTTVPQPRLFALDALGKAGWLKALRLEGYAPRRPRVPLALQQALFPYAEALQRRPGTSSRRGGTFLVLRAAGGRPGSRGRPCLGDAQHLLAHAAGTDPRREQPGGHPS
jgi:hypothetical protein